MSALLSIIVFILFSVVYNGYDALQIGGFRDIQQHGVVLRLSADSARRRVR